MNENEEKIYDLIGSKSFAELTEDERALVHESLGSEALYEKMREANLAAGEALSDDLPPPPGMKASVMASFDEKDEKRGIVWWKYAAAVAVLVIGAFLFWPSGNLEREPIAENVEKKDSTERKKEEPVEAKKVEESVVENEQPAENNEVEFEELKAPTTTSSESVEMTDEVVVTEISAASPEEDVAEMEMDFADQAVSTSEREDFTEEENEMQSTSELAASFNVSDTSPAGSNEFSKPQMNVESARSATAMSADLMKQEVSFEGISLESIGWPEKKTYVAY